MTDPQNDLTAQTLPQPSRQPALAPLTTSSMPLAKGGLGRSELPAPCETLNSQLSTLNSSALKFSTAPLQSLQSRSTGKPRNGKIAHLPKLERDMVNRMLSN